MTNYRQQVSENSPSYHLLLHSIDYSQGIELSLFGIMARSFYRELFLYFLHLVVLEMDLLRKLHEYWVWWVAFLWHIIFMITLYPF